jgi:DNA-directed RNA polymerase specialized sigma24 family protein
MELAELEPATLLGAKACRDGDAFAEVYDRHVKEVLAWARARIGEPAADLTAEVFARAWLRRSRFRDQEQGSALPWLLGIAQNVLRESLRKQRIEDSGRRRLGLPGLVVRDTGRFRTKSVERSRRCPRRIASSSGCG